MIFAIYRNFLEFFMNLYEFISNFYHLKQLKKCKKRGYFMRGFTWMRHGTQGHVALPRGRARVPAWRGGDM